VNLGKFSCQVWSQRGSRCNTLVPLSPSQKSIARIVLFLHIFEEGRANRHSQALLGIGNPSPPVMCVRRRPFQPANLVKGLCGLTGLG
jgi:hypothetical protein